LEKEEALSQLSSIRNGSSQTTSIEVGGFRVIDATFPPLLKLAPHYHQRAGFSVILEGGLEKEFGSLTITSPAPGFVTMPPAEKHKAIFAQTGGHLLIIEPDATLRELLRPCNGLLERVSHARDPKVTQIARRITWEMQTPDDLSPLAIEGLVLELLATAARGKGRSETEGRPPPWLLNARDYLHDHFASSVQVKEVAAQVGVHPVHLARVFRAYYGLSPVEYIRQLRINLAESLLADPQRTLGEIALRTGFADQSHFTRAFRNQVGLTPARYRQISLA
jgi:AraC family transcriptional regulator